MCSGVLALTLFSASGCVDNEKIVAIQEELFNLEAQGERAAALVVKYANKIAEIAPQVEVMAKKIAEVYRKIKDKTITAADGLQLIADLQQTKEMLESELAGVEEDYAEARNLKEGLAASAVSLRAKWKAALDEDIPWWKIALGVALPLAGMLIKHLLSIPATNNLKMVASHYRNSMPDDIIDETDKKGLATLGSIVGKLIEWDETPG